MLRHLPSRTGFAEESWLPRRTCGLCKLSLLLIYERMPVDFVVLSLNSRAYTLVRREIFRSVSVPFRPKSFYAITAFQSVTSYESIKVSSDPNESPSNLSSVVMFACHHVVSTHLVTPGCTDIFHSTSRLPRRQSNKQTKWKISAYGGSNNSLSTCRRRTHTL